MYSTYKCDGKSLLDVLVGYVFSVGFVSWLSNDTSLKLCFFADVCVFGYVACIYAIGMMCNLVTSSIIKINERDFIILFWYIFTQMYQNE